MERNFEFRKELLQVHKPERNSSSALEEIQGVQVNNDWEILYPEEAGRVLRYVAKDLQEYFSISQEVFLRARPVKEIAQEAENPSNKIILGTAKALPRYVPEEKGAWPYRLLVCDGIIVCGLEERGVAQGCYYIEDSMNLNQGAVLEYQDVVRYSKFSPRMTHSGYGLDMFPDAHLKAIAHSGMDAILLFVKDVDRTPHGYLDFNELIWRAEGFGLDVYAYSYYVSEKHPDDEGALEHYESTYGKLFKSCPGLKGVVLVGESMEFPSKDPHTTGRPYYESTLENNPEGKPSPGWYPCYDYPQWLTMVKKVIRDKNPQADIVFWSYNWGYVEADARLALIRNLPKDISLLVTYEMFETFEISEEIEIRCVDYTLFFEGPGKYFISEAEEAVKQGIRLYAMCNTGGLTWDIGVIPYEPAPYQWKRRYDGLLEAREKWGLTGLMESHHFGYFPSFISELTKWAYWSSSPTFDEIVFRIAVRDYGKENADKILEVWGYYSEGIRKYISTNEDQYGPFRIGPAYPLLFLEEETIPSPPHVLFGGNSICKPLYYYDPTKLSTLYYELESLGEMLELYERGNQILESIVKTLVGRRKEQGEKFLGLGKFIARSTKTTINVKKWFLLKLELLERAGDKNRICTEGNSIAHIQKPGPMSSSREKSDIVREMIALGEEEIANAESTIPLVERDSRLGFEPSMEYMCDKAHIHWKIRVTRKAMEELLREYL